MDDIHIMRILVLPFSCAVLSLFWFMWLLVDLLFDPSNLKQTWHEYLRNLRLALDIWY